MTLDANSIRYLAQLQELGIPALDALPPDQGRAERRRRPRPAPGPATVRAQPVSIPAAAGEPVPARVLIPAGRPRGVLVYLHGGGWVFGEPDEFDALCRTLADRTGATVLLVDYRLAPEHPFPAGLQDAWSALEWAAQHRAELAAEPDAPLLVAGDSAGGNLAAVVCRWARDRGGPLIALQALVYPVTDSDLDTPSYLDPANQLVVNRRVMAWFWDQYLPDPARRAQPDAAPLRADGLAGLPPAVVITAEHDVLRDEGERYAARLADAGVPVTHRRFDGQLHGFFTNLDQLPQSRVAIDLVADAISARLAAPAP